MNAAEAQAARWAGRAPARAAAPAAAVPGPRAGDTARAEALLAAADWSDVWAPLAAACALRGSGDAVADLGSGAALAYGAVAARCSRVGAWLARADAGAVVGVLAPNGLAAFEVHFAVGGFAGGVVLNCNPRWSRDELRFCLGAAECRAVVAAAAARDAVAGAGAALAALLWAGGDDGAPSGLAPAEASYEAVARGGPAPERAGFRGDGDAGCEMYYTSGTSGRPKGVVLARRVVLLHAAGCLREHRIHGGDCWLHVAPLFHLVDAYAVFAITWVGGRHVILPAFDGRGVAAAVGERRVTVSNVASTMVTLLLADAAVRRADFSSLELLSCGGAPLAPATVRAAVATFGCEFFLSYGMTECCGKIAMSLVDAAVRAELGPAGTLDLVCSSGRPFFLLDVRVVAGSTSAAPADEDDAADVARGAGAVGEVRIRAELKSSTRLQC